MASVAMGTQDGSKIRKARKSYMCHECRKTIEMGSRYLDFKIGLMNSVRVHVHCALKAYDGDRWLYGCNALVDERNALTQQAILYRAPAQPREDS